MLRIDQPCARSRETEPGTDRGFSKRGLAHACAVTTEAASPFAFFARMSTTHPRPFCAKPGGVYPQNSVRFQLRSLSVVS